MKLIVITGPAGSGKSSLSVELEHKFCMEHIDCGESFLNVLGLDMSLEWKEHPVEEIVAETRRYLQTCGAIYKKNDPLYIAKQVDQDIEDCRYYDNLKEDDYVVVSGIRTQNELDYLMSKHDVRLHIKLVGKNLPTVNYSHESEREVRDLCVKGNTVLFDNTYDQNFFIRVESFMHTWLHGESLREKNV